MPRFRSFVAMFLALSVAFAVASPPAGAATGRVLLSDGFEAQVLRTWSDGVTYGNWRSVYDGYGVNAVVLDGVNRVLAQTPKASTSLGETHAGLVTSVKSFTGNLDIAVRLKTVRQLRTPKPNPWETAWVAWNYTNDHHFYYLALKTNGWELAKVDNTKKDPAGPACLWPAYVNCKYAGAQRYLITRSSPTYSVSAWYSIRVTQVGSAITLYVNGARIGSFTDQDHAYTAGSLGLYDEDAAVLFDDVVVKRP
jgi:3-keto-disaccharide hydrolase